MSISKRCTPYLWHSLVAIALCMLMLSPASANMHPPQPIWGPGGEYDPCDGDWDCDGIEDVDDMCIQNADHWKAAKMKVCDCKRAPISTNVDKRCSILKGDIDSATMYSATLGSFSLATTGWAWPVSGFAAVLALGGTFGTIRMQKMYDKARCGDSARADHLYEDEE